MSRGLSSILIAVMCGVCAACDEAAGDDKADEMDGTSGSTSQPIAGKGSSGQGGMNAGGSHAAGAAGSTLPPDMRAGSFAPATDAGPDAMTMQPAPDAASELDASGPREFPIDRAAFGLGGASRCSGSDLLLCEDFESGAIDQSTWEVQTWGQGQAVVDEQQAARGSRALHVTEPSAISRVMLRETKTFADTGNHFFGRFFLRLPYASEALQCANNQCPNLVHWTAASAGGDYMAGGETYRPDVRAIGAVNQNLLVNLDGGPDAEVGVSDDDSAPQGYRGFDDSHVDEWMCFEFEYAGEGESAEVRVWWDGQAHEGLHYSTDHRGDGGELWPIPRYDYVELGFAHYQDYGGFVEQFDAYLDEIAIDDERIGCAR